ncbi:MAG: amidohydrolase family protein [Candidatus Thorarchaeota archaeon]|jgi:putative selenium metabolism protein SsnA
MGERTLIENGLVVTCDKSNMVIENGYVLIEDTKIAEIGDGKPPKRLDTTIDASGKVVIPGIITAHTHLYGILLRGASLNIDPPVDFAQVLQRVWWPVDEALTPDDAWASALSASADMLRNGSTFFADTYSGPNSIESTLDRIADATERIGIRSLLAFEATERNTTEEGARGIEENVRFAKSVAQASDLTSLMMSIHASFTVSDDLIIEAVKRADELEIPLTIHTSEGLVDLYHNLERYGERTVERLSRLGALGDRTVLAHCVHVDSNELDLISKSGTSVAHNPMSNMLNAVGTSPVPDMLARGITVGLGNDGWIFDPFENMRCALTVHRLEARNPSVIGSDQVFRMATIDGARCYGMDEMIGSIETGKLADLVVLDGTRVPTPLNPSSVIGHLVNTFGGRDVTDVLVNGVHVIKGRRLTKISDEEVSDKSTDSAESLWSRL